jgi:hypothetical protein
VCCVAPPQNTPGISRRRALQPGPSRSETWTIYLDRPPKLYPLTDFKPCKAENIERGYLQGRYGAIPFLEELTRVAE